MNKRKVGIVGARACSQQALQNTYLAASILKERYVIVSGLAKGVDAASHQGALSSHTIGIIGCGIDRIYPFENKALFQEMANHHLILSEYPGHTPPLRHHFPWRNRLIAGCIDALIVVEAKHKSGTMHTVDACNELGVDVYCMPTTFNNTAYGGCNYLIQNGANILADIEDLYEL